MGKGYYDDNSSQTVAEHGGSNRDNGERHGSSGERSHNSRYGNENHHHSSSHSHSGHSSGHHHHHYHEDKSSEMERNGDNIIYRNVRKGKVFASIKRALFCIVMVVFLIFTVSSIINSTPEEGFGFFKRRTTKTEEIEDLKSRLNEYQDRIDELEAELEQYKAKESNGAADKDK